MKRCFPLLLWGFVLWFAFTPAAMAQTRGEDAGPGRTRGPQSDPGAQQRARTEGRIEIEDRDGDGQWQIKREQAFRMGRMSPDDRPAAFHLQRAHLQKNLQRDMQTAIDVLNAATGMAATASTVTWQNLGPSPQISDAYGRGTQDYGNVVGRVTAIAVDPTDSTGNTVYIGAASGGVWRSRNAAAQNASSVAFAPILDSVAPTLTVGSIAVKPNDGNTILVGTGEPNNAIDSYYGLGILRSTDGGNTWTVISGADSGAKSFRGLGISTIVFRPDNPNFVVAGGASASQQLGSYYSTNRGIYYSTDAGATWRSGTLTDDGVNAFVDSPQSIVYNSNLGKWFAAVKYHGFYSSPDGIIWTRLPVANQPGGSLLNTASCPTTVVSAASCPYFRGALAMRQDTNELFAYYLNASYVNQGIYRSINGGQSWTQLTSTGFDSCGESSGCGSAQGFYNVALTAVPNGANTDVYLGSINVFKCSIVGNQGCTAWLNLSHVYGCYPLSVNSHLHPDQHAIEYVATANHVTSTVYFGNDGGVYRTLDSANFSNGTCSGSRNPVDNLNLNMGSTLQFVGFSQHPSDPSILLAGAQDNGTSSISSSTAGANGATWTAFQGGDGGYNIIDPANPAVWYASFPDGEITRCTSGPDCRGFFNTVLYPDDGVFSSDYTPFYTKFILDASNHSMMLVGTCRVWRGNADGSGWPGANAITFNLSTGDSTICNGSHSSIRAMDTGGPSVNGASEVIYAGDTRGQVWVTTGASAGPTSWSKRLGPHVAPNNYYIPISSIVVDPSDSSGQTAYVTVMGFGVPHVYQTTSAGASWTDLSGNLPDAPADALAIDPTNNKILYVGTDVGVFMTNLAVTPITWSEWGGSTLPNVPVTQIAIFNTPSLQKLRVSTYGRGVWQADLASASAPTPADERHRPGPPTVRKGDAPPPSGSTSTSTLPPAPGSGKSLTNVATDPSHRNNNPVRKAENQPAAGSNAVPVVIGPSGLTSASTAAIVQTDHAEGQGDESTRDTDANAPVIDPADAEKKAEQKAKQEQKTGTASSPEGAAAGTPIQHGPQ